MRAARQSPRTPQTLPPQQINHPGPLRSLAATARLANIPSVISNVWLGIVPGAMAAGTVIDARFWTSSALLCCSGAGLYLTGNFLNDWADRDWDARHRPERALPRRLFPPRLYLFLAIGFAALGLWAASTAHPRSLAAAAAIGICIVLYTWVHKRAAWSVVPMALCRALLPIMGFMAFAGRNPPAVVIAAAAGLFCHVAGLSLVARFETMAPPPATAMRLARGLFPLAALSVFLGGHFGLALPLWICALGLIPYGLWITLCLTRFRHPVSAMVSNLLAGIPLVDWILLLPIFLAPSPPGLLATLCLWLPPLAFLGGKLLQRLAPAT